MPDPFDDVLSGLDTPRIRTSLRISGDTLDPDFLSQQLGMAPAFSASKGDRHGRGGRDEFHERGIWVYRVDVPPGTELGDAIHSLLERLPEDSTLWGEITSSYQVDVFCGIFLQGDNQSTIIGPEVLTALSRRGFLLHLDLYGPFGLDQDISG